MSLYKPARTFAIDARKPGRRNATDQGIMDLLNEYAALRDETVNTTGRRVLLEVLPSKIAELKRQRKRKSA
jgi:hypothetical protein